MAKNVSVSRGNPFYIEPADFMPGLNALYSGMRAGAEAGQERKAEEDKQLKLDLFAEESPNMSPTQIGQFLIKNPDLAEHISTQMDASTAIENDRAVAAAWDVVTGDVPAHQSVLGLAEEQIGKGEDAGELLNIAEDAMKGGEKALKGAYATLAAKDGANLKLYMEATGQKTEDKTNDMQNWDKFKTLSGKEQLQFGKAAGFIEKDSNPNETDIDDYVADGELCRSGDQAACKRNEDRAAFKRETPEQAAEKKQSVDAATEAGKLADRLPQIKQYISQLEEVKRLVDSGAGTGAIEGRLPSFREASVELENVRNQLGLSVIQSVTFGPLSEKELKFALDTALPDKLEGPALKKWVNRKIKAQKALAAFVEEAVNFLSVPGNTKGGWIAYQRNQIKALPEGWTEGEIRGNMDKYELSRNEVIAQINAGGGKK